MKVRNARQEDLPLILQILDDGRITEQGTHDELLAHGGSYPDMWAAQQALESIGKGEA